ncbi:MAG: glycerophosphodiester phosphodiesterase family protein [Bacteroidota bacterium]
MAFKRILYFSLGILLLTACRGTTQAPQETADRLPNLQFADAESLREAFVWKSDNPALISAHRGGPEAGFPENCLETFENTIGYAPSILEMDVVQSSDGVLYLMHDNSLDRTTNGTGKVSDQPWSYVETLKLIDNDGAATNFEVPTLMETLAWGRGKAILSLDVKRGVPFEQVVAEVEEAKAESYIMVIVYNLKDAQKVHNLNPRLMMSVSIRNQEELDRFKATGIPSTQIVAFTGTRLKEARFYKQLHDEGISCILGTLGNLDKQAAARGDELYLQHRDLGVDIFATDRPAAVAKVLYGTK